MTIKAIIWDNWGVLVNAICGSYVLLWAERLEVPQEDVIRLMRSPENKRWDLDEIGNDEFFDFVIRDIGLPAEKKAALTSISIDDFCYDKELLGYIQNLKNRYTIVMLTNTDRDSFNEAQGRWPELYEAFDHVITSFEVKLIKPDPKIFQLTLNKIGCKAEEAIFIDDSEVNVKAAEKLGIHGIVFQDREQAIKKLESLIS